MSSDPSLALQKALVAALKGQTDAGDNVFDSPPPPTSGSGDTSFPRITLGGGQSIGQRLGNKTDACFYDGSESFLDIDVWSRKVGYPEAKTIADQVRDHLDDAALTLEGHQLELLMFQNTIFQREPDGLTSRARMTVRALTQPIA